MCLALFLLTLSCTSTGGEKRGKSKEEVLPGVTADYKLSEDGTLLTLIFECECEYNGGSICEVRDVDRPNERKWALFFGRYRPYKWVNYIVSFDVVVPQGETWEPITAESNDGECVDLFIKDYKGKSNSTLTDDNGIKWYEVWSSSEDSSTLLLEGGKMIKVSPGYKAVLLEGGNALRIQIYPPYKESYIRTELKMRRYK